jgi:hypothetical protein
LYQYYLNIILNSKLLIQKYKYLFFSIFLILIVFADKICYNPAMRENLEVEVCKLCDFTRNTFYVWKREGRPIIALLERYFTKNELNEFLETKKIERFEHSTLLEDVQLILERKYFPAFWFSIKDDTTEETIRNEWFRYFEFMFAYFDLIFKFEFEDGNDFHKYILENINHLKIVDSFSFGILNNILNFDPTVVKFLQAGKKDLFLTTMTFNHQETILHIVTLLAHKAGVTIDSLADDFKNITDQIRIGWDYNKDDTIEYSTLGDSLPMLFEKYYNLIKPQ